MATSPQPGWQRTPTRAEITLFDDFSGSEIDPDKWTVNPHSSDNVLPYVKDEKLHLEVTRDTPKDDRGENHALLQAKLRRPITDVSFDMTMASRSGTNKGGGYANVSTDNDREQKVVLKSGNPGRDSPHLDYYIYVETDCSNGAYRDFKHPNQHDIQVGTTHHVHIYYDNRGWIFQVDDLQPVITGSEDGPIENLSFSLFSSGEPFHITVADVRVGYA